MQWLVDSEVELESEKYHNPLGSHPNHLLPRNAGKFAGQVNQQPDMLQLFIIVMQRLHNICFYLLSTVYVFYFS